MFLKKTDKICRHPYMTLFVGTLTLIGAASVVRCAKNMMYMGYDKIVGMTKMMSCRKKGSSGTQE